MHIFQRYKGVHFQHNCSTPMFQEVTHDKCIINVNGMFALIRLPGRFISSFRNVFSYSAYMPPLPPIQTHPKPLIKLYKPRALTLAWNGV